MTDKFEIVVDPARNFIRVLMRGHWDLDTVRQYKQSILASVGELRAAGCVVGETVALVDLRDGGAQSQEVIAAYKDELDAPDLIPRRLATLVSSALFKRQVERIAIPNQRLFDDEEKALGWLFSPRDTK